MPGRKKLEPRQIQQVALDLVDRDGLHALTMRSLAHELGTGTMTLYGYVADRAALDALVVAAVLDEARPDVVLLQEIKTVDAGFPRESFEERGYNVQTHGQKGFNGVAILSRRPLEDVTRGLPGDEEDDQARWIEATVVGKTAIRICGLYLPNGNPVELSADGTPVPGGKYAFKLT